MVEADRENEEVPQVANKVVEPSEDPIENVCIN